ncbi:MAG: transglutaminase-like domain-containing protein [Gammaproteobacteria bacterium]|nr:transglutaminase-like domain-containing protein [Gammaproteobacteria bacterium]
MLGASSLLCTVLLFAGNPCEPMRILDQMIESIHDDMAGEHWYEVRFQDRTIGSLHESRSKLPSGEYVLNRSLRFSLMRNRITHVEERIVFSSEFPYPLLKADQETTVTHRGHRTRSLRSFPIETMSDLQQSTLSYLDTQAFHPRWIANRDQIETRSIDFVDIDSNTTTWRISASAHNDSDLTITSADGSTTHLVSSTGVPSHSDLVGGIHLSAVEGPLTQPWADNEYVFDSGGVSVPVNEAIADHHRLVALTLRLDASDVSRNLWKPISDNDGFIRIDRRSPQPTDEHQIEAAHLHAELPAHGSVSSLIREVEIDSKATYTNVKRLVDSLYERIEYEDISHASSIEATLSRKTGDCTEFADLVDAVATKLGWDSRIRTGLAYHSPSQTFRPHSWNEIAIDGHWISADASWGQFPADASHVPFPRANVLALLAQASSTRFEVVDHQYTVD